MEIWLILFVLFVIIEFSTPGVFFGAVFAIASLITYLVSLFVTENFWLLTAVYSILSIILVYALRPILTKTFKVNETVKPSNIESFMMKEGIVTEKIERNTKGRVLVDNESWLAASKDNEEIEIGTVVNLELIDGTTLFVSVKES